MRHEFGVIPIVTQVFLLNRRSKCYEKAVKFYPEIFEFKVEME